MIDERMRDYAIVRLARTIEWLANRENQSHAVFQTIADLAGDPANLDQIKRIAQQSADIRKSPE